MESDTTPLVAGLIVLGLVLLVVIVLAVVIVYWLIRKLRQHENDILKLQAAENGTVKSSIKRAVQIRDSAIELNDVDIQEATGRRRPLSQASEISNRSRVRARMTVMIQKEQANLYGFAPPLGQVLMTAQHYYKVHTNTNKDIPVESVQIVDKDTNRKSVVSKVLTEDWREGLPTSLLFNGATHKIDDIFSQNEGIFVHKTIGPGGGLLKVSGVSVTIPPTALDEDKLISLGVLWDKKFTPLLTGKQCLLSPIVLCQPSGLKFKTPVTLTFPHAAVDVTSNWIPKVLKREGDLMDDTDWVPITLADYEERHVTGSHISLELNHFTLYTCIGESKPGKMAAKLVHIVAFSGKLQRGSFFKPRIYCINKYKEELEEVESLVGKMDSSSKLSETTDLVILDNQQDVMVEMAKLSDDWNLAGDRTEVLPFDQVWHCFHPHCTFVLKPKKSSLSEIFCEIHAFQNGDDNKAAKLKIAEKMSPSSSPLSSIEDDPQEDIIRELIILLDPRTEAGTDAGDWRNLAEVMGCDLARIRWLGTQSSPTRVLIEKWLEDGKNFKELEQIMKDIHREDAAEEINNRSQDIEKSTES